MIKPTVALTRNFCAVCEAPAYRQSVREVLCDSCQVVALKDQQITALEDCLREFIESDTCYCSDKDHHDCAWCVGMELMGEDVD